MDPPNRTKILRDKARQWWFNLSPPAILWRSIMDTAHHSALAAKHAKIEQRIADEARRPAPDSAVVAMLKKRKLRIKEALSIS